VVNTEIALDKGIDGRNGPALAAARLALRRYLDVYPGGRLAPEVERKLNTLAAAEAAHLADNAAWAEAERTGTGEALRRYLATHPSGENAGYARMALAAIEASEARRKADHAAWSAATEDGSKVGLRRYLAAYPDGDHAAYARATLAVIEASEAHVRADRTAWGRAEAEASASAFNGYLAAYPDGEHASLARQRLSGMQASATSRQAESIALIEPQPDASGDVLRRDVDPNPNPNRDAAGASANPAPLLDTTLESLEQDPLREHADWLKAQRGHTKASYAAYLLTHPNGRHAKEARANIAELQNSSAKPKPAANGKSIKQVTQVFRSAPGDAPASQKWQSADEPFIGADGRIRQR
jgi:outer membrane protein assembly factor BamD (BamD/ComL family)